MMKLIIAKVESQILFSVFQLIWENINEKIIVLQKDLENLRKEYTEYDEKEKDINNQLNALTKN